MDISADAMSGLIDSSFRVKNTSQACQGLNYATALSTFASSFNSNSSRDAKRTVHRDSDSIKGNIQRIWSTHKEIENRHSESNLKFSLENPWNHILIQQNHRSQQEDLQVVDSNQPQMVEFPSQVFRSAQLSRGDGPETPKYNQTDLSDERRQALRLISNTNLEQLSVSELLDLMTADKTTSIVFQKYIYTVWKRGFTNIRSTVVSNLEYLATDPLGNYVLQILLLRDVQMRSKIEEFCVKNFHVWKDNEYASRLMQSVLEVSHNFQLFASRSFSKNPKACAKNISCVFLTLALIRNCADQNWLAFLRDYVLANAKAVLENRHMRRLIASLCEEGSHEFLDQFLSKMYSTVSLERIIREKSLTSILQTMIVRSHSNSVAVFGNLLKHRIDSLVVSGFFKYLLRKCARMNHCDYHFLQKMTTTTLLKSDIDKLLQVNMPNALRDLVLWLELSSTGGRTISVNPSADRQSDQLVSYMKQYLDTVELSQVQEDLACGPVFTF